MHDDLMKTMHVQRFGQESESASEGQENTEIYTTTNKKLHFQAEIPQIHSLTSD